jgi:PUB domain.
LERKAHHGKLSSKLGIEGYNPDAIQYDVSAEAGAHADHHSEKKIKASVSKIEDYISKVSSYKAGGDGGVCLKTLIAYIKNIVEKPNEQKFRKINMENKAYKTRVKPFVGAKALLLAVGFHPNEGNDALVLEDDANMETLKQTKDKLEAAYAAY